ncbi:MAG: nitroreductase family protein [Candidatus Aenigmarchaeota archaeon]|nr:nitroreductase family protein [Candidatus Aenigmarchaeota archaeon]
MVFDTVARFAKSKSEREEGKKKMKGKTGNENNKGNANKANEKKELTYFSAVYSVIKGRKSVRKYQDKKVDGNIIELLIQAASYAPSAGNQQPWEFVVVRDKGNILNIARACFDQDWVASAPVVIVAGVNMRLAEAIYGERGAKLYGVQGVAAAIENMLLTATSLGLGTCWVGAFAEPEITFAVGFPEYIRPCAIITLGYPAEKAKETRRHPVKDFVFFERYSHLPKYVQ